MSAESQAVMKETLRVNDAVDDRIATITSQLTDYNTVMGPAQPIDTATGAKYQKRLFNIYMDALKHETSDFIRIWDAILAFAHRHRDGAFRIPALYRFPENTPMSRIEMRNFQRLSLILIKTANPATRWENLKQLSLDTSLSDLTGAQADKIRAYYTPN